MTTPITPAFGATNYLQDTLEAYTADPTVDYPSIKTTKDRRTLMDAVTQITHEEDVVEGYDIRKFLDEIQEQMNRLGFEGDDQRLMWENIASIGMISDDLIDAALERADDVTASNPFLRETRESILAEYGFRP